CVQGTHFPQTF
nr:immunoglobulin light chain junction region [Mus musculus]